MEARHEDGPRPRGGAAETQPGLSGAGDAARWALGAALAGFISRWWLLGLDGEAAGYDVWYYVLQVRSLRAGRDLFEDDSWLFPLLHAVSGLTGDEVLAVECVSAGAAAAVCAALAVAGHRLGGRGGACVAAAVAVASTGHMALSMEFAKNALGAAFFATAVASLCAPSPGRRGVGVALAAAAAAVMVHKLAGVLALGWVLACAVAAVGRRAPWVAVAVAGVGAVAASGLALLGVVGWTDLARGLALEGPGVRVARLGELGPWEQGEMVAVHLAPAGAAAVAWWRGFEGTWWLALLAVATVTAAPGLPFDYDGVAWRLLCMGFVPVALVGAASRPTMPVAGWVAAAALMATVSTAPSRRKRSPDYARWQEVLVVVQAHVPPDGRLVAHRGLCGFLWAEGDRRCENFEPSGDLSKVWRVTYGFSEQVLRGHGTSVGLLPGYRLIREPDWQRFRAERGDEFPLARNPRNPWRARPAYVKIAGPEEAP